MSELKEEGSRRRERDGWGQGPKRSGLEPVDAQKLCFRVCGTTRRTRILRPAAA